MKIIVLGSTNPVKLEATKQAFGAYYDHFEVKPLSLPSGVILSLQQMKRHYKGQ